jgi:hypothetical protein
MTKCWLLREDVLHHLLVEMHNPAKGARYYQAAIAVLAPPQHQDSNNQPEG